MNTKNNDTPHFNIADIIIIIAAVAMIIALVLRVYNIFGAADETAKVRIEFEVPCISGENISFKEKEKLYYSGDDSLVGYIEEFDVNEAVQYAYNENGELVKATVMGKSTITGTIVIECTKTEKGYYLGGTRLLSEGDKLCFYTTTREMEFTFIKISEVKDEEDGGNKESLPGFFSPSVTTESK